MLFPEYAREGYSIVWGRQHKMNEPLMLITYVPWDGLETGSDKEEVGQLTARSWGAKAPMQ